MTPEKQPVADLFYPREILLKAANVLALHPSYIEARVAAAWQEVIHLERLRLPEELRPDLERILEMYDRAHKNKTGRLSRANSRRLALRILDLGSKVRAMIEDRTRGRERASASNCRR